MKTLLALGFLAFAVAVAPAEARSSIDRNSMIAERAASLKPGQFVWDTKTASTGPLFLVIDLTAQRAMVYRDGVVIGASTISSGSEGRETPTGVFTILEKKVTHRSSTYDDAPMPYMQRLTWKGVAMHAGDLPGYPASRGCIRFPYEFAKQLYGITEIGTAVMITDDAEIAEQERRAAEYQHANEEFARALAEQQAAANRALIEYNRVRTAHEENLRRHELEMARYRSVVARK